ncbi:alpha-hydroxy-acid oxidizing protein [Kitasatospora sp. NPDC056651]|uniref:alpha-hydroxy-acid oxidizing protein n=1 Tax=Kitasatospora sp. NPDC056651 TaxID=3345892 RepID=UPI0036847F5D
MGTLTLAGIERAARAELPPEIWDFIEGGAGAERTLAANREIFGHHALRPRTLVDVSACDPALTLPVLFDGGVRGGTDIAVALALGARAVLVGRPALWGLPAGGEAGLYRVLDLLREELEHTMALLGRPRLADLDRTVLAPWPRPAAG